MKYKLWNKIDTINGVEPEHFLNQKMFQNTDIILIYDEKTNVVSQVESKEVLSNVYSIDSTLKLDDFMSAYYKKLEEIRVEQERLEAERLTREKEFEK